MTQGRRTPVTDALLAAIVAEIHNRAEKAPPGFYTLEDWQKRWKCKSSCAKRYLNEGIRLGLVERIILRHSYAGKYVRQAPYFGPVRNKARQKPAR
jgi:Fic family protein